MDQTSSVNLVLGSHVVVILDDDAYGRLFADLSWAFSLVPEADSRDLSSLEGKLARATRTALKAVLDSLDALARHELGPAASALTATWSRTARVARLFLLLEAASHHYPLHTWKIYDKESPCPLRSQPT